jgi:hypothetical protein
LSAVVFDESLAEGAPEQLSMSKWGEQPRGGLFVLG